MQGRWDAIAIVSAVCIAAYAAIAIRHVAHYDLGFSLSEIRGAAVAIAIIIAALTGIDFFGKKLRKTR
jgi:tetrahydromethanopterin S-methyltransferase subunit C